MVDTDNSNERFDTYFSTTEKDKESFNVSRPLNIATNSAGVATSVDFTTKLKRTIDTCEIFRTIMLSDSSKISSFASL